MVADHPTTQTIYVIHSQPFSESTVKNRGVEGICCIQLSTDVVAPPFSLIANVAEAATGNNNFYLSALANKT